MANEMRLSSKDIEKIADDLNKANKDLKNELKETATVMKNLGKSWDSPAYKESNSAFAKFEEEYSSNYEKLINQYVKFLKENVSTGYKKTESQNREIASEYK